MSELSKKVGKRIRQIREKKNIKQCVLAEMLDMEPSNLTRIESGSQFPKEQNLVKIAQALDVEVKDLFTFPNATSKKEMLAKIEKILSELNINELISIYNYANDFLINSNENSD